MPRASDSPEATPIAASSWGHTIPWTRRQRRRLVLSQDILRLGHQVRIEPQCGGADVDCRLLFMGDRCRQLVRTYPEAIHRLSRRGSPAAIARYVSESREILQFYDVH